MVDLSPTTSQYSGSNDNIAVRNVLQDKPGGIAISFDGFPDDAVEAGHGVIYENDVFKPQPVDGSSHVLLVGVVRSRTEKSNPLSGLVTQGTINNNALKYPFNQESLDALKAFGIHNVTDQYPSTEKGAPASSN